MARFLLGLALTLALSSVAGAVLFSIILFSVAAGLSGQAVQPLVVAWFVFCAYLFVIGRRKYREILSDARQRRDLH